MTRRERQSARPGIGWSRRWIAAGLIGCFVLACLRFALVQDVWIDESTQLSGVRLPIAELVRWLSGSDPDRFGVPGDRMPPLAYLLDHVWWQAAGAAVLRFRMFHVLLTSLGVVLIAQAEFAALGRQWLGIAVAFLAFSPKLIEIAVELRSYPLFFAITCALLGLFLKIVKRSEHPPGWGRLLLFGGGCAALAYCHFFGVVAAFSFFATLMLAFRRNRAALLRVVIVGAGLGLGLAGLYPFIFGASSISAAAAPAAPGSIASYLPLLVGHPALLIFPLAAVLYFAASAALLLAAMVGIAQRAAQRRTAPLDWLLAVAMIGCAATILPGFLISAFSAFKPSYSIWLLPVFALLIALGAAPLGRPRWDRYGRPGAIAALLLGAAIATGVFLIEAPWFVHGPHRIIAAAREQSPQPAAIIYAEPATFAYGYFPMVYDSGGRLPQFVDTAAGVARLGKAFASPAAPLSALAPYRGLVVVAIRTRHYRDLRQCLEDRCPAFPEPPLVAELVRSGRWAIAAHRRAFGFYDADITRLIPARPPPAGRKSR